MRLDFADQGTYVCTEGPRLDTPAEVRKYASYGGDLIGQTLAPEAFLAKELEMCYAALCYVVHYAEGVKERKSAPTELLGGLMTRSEKRRVEAAAAYVPKILARVMERLPKSKLVCACQESMEYYRKQKRISDNWREWAESVIIRARYALCDGERLARDVALRVEGARLAPLQNPSGEPDRVIDCGNRVLLPAPLNAHTHLELSHLAGRVLIKRRFPALGHATGAQAVPLQPPALDPGRAHGGAPIAPKRQRLHGRHLHAPRTRRSNRPVPTCPAAPFSK